MEHKRFNLWQKYVTNLAAPQQFLDFGYYWLISAALQRRVFLQSPERPLFSNLYVVLVGPPAVGKGLVIQPVAEILKAHKLHVNGHPSPSHIPSIDEMKMSEESRKLIEMTQELEATVTKALDSGQNKLEEKLLFPVAPDDITYESLVNTTASSLRRIRIPVPCPIMAPSGYYGHCSIAVCLEEMATLFKKNSDKCLKFLLKAFDCGDYDYKTIGRGQDKVKRCCLSLLAGTTPGQVKEMLDEKIVDDGWSSRCVFIYAEKPRRYVFGISAFSDEQMEAKQAIIRHVKDLSGIYGLVQYSPDAYAYLYDYFVTSWEKAPKNKDIRLAPYYGRKNIHVPKLAMAIHFSECEVIRGKTDMTLTLEEVQRAVAMLGEAETRMHLALNFKKRNPLAEATDAILELLKSRPNISRNEVLSATWDQLPNGDESLSMIMDFLESTNRIAKKEITDEGGRNVYVFYIHPEYLASIGNSDTILE